ncbi:tetratricopeptide repeat protein [Candidatus Sumerlaeota bacterium]|nr:tetratricopeptide repeat protein [Candidatus Sumerlaeota bacterium]
MPHTRLIRETLIKAEEYIQDRRYNEAIMALKEVEALDSFNTQILASLCATYMHVGMMKDAAKCAERWLKAAPDNPMVYTTLGSLKLYKGGQWYGPGFELEKALEYLDKAIKLDPQCESAAQLAGLACFHHGNYDLASHYLRMAAEINPMHAQYHYWQGRADFLRGDYDSAANSLRRAIRLNNNHPQAYRFLGWVYYEMREWDKSIRAYEKAIQVSPHDPTPYLRLGLIYGIHQDRFQKAMDHFEAAIHRFPEWLPGYTGLADVHREHAQFAKAVAWYVRALRLDPSAGYPLVQLYHLFRDIGEEEIVKEIARVGARAKRKADYEEMDYIDRARFFAIVGNVRRARQLLQQYADKYPKGRGNSVLKDYNILIDHPNALIKVDKSILKKIKSKLTPKEAESARKEAAIQKTSSKRKSSKDKAIDRAMNHTGGFYSHEYVLLRQFDWGPSEEQREDARALWNEFYKAFKN